jgi:hypothetical protein
MKKMIYILILTLNLAICLAQETQVELGHTNNVECNKDATNPKCMELWDMLESLS